jgi:hypothetical protein
LEPEKTIVYLDGAEPVGVHVHGRLDSLETPADILAKVSYTGQRAKAPFEVVGPVGFTLQRKRSIIC